MNRDLDLASNLRSLTLEQYIGLFGAYWDRTKKQMTPFNLWPAQKKYCRFIEKHKEVWTPKPRQWGASEMSAERLMKSVLQNKGVETVVLSQSFDYAKYFLKYRIKRKYQYVANQAGVIVPAIKSESMEHLELANESVFRCLSATNTSGESMSLDCIVLDEPGSFDSQPGANFGELYDNISPTLYQAGPDAWLMIIGTSKPGSSYNERLKRIYHKKNTTSHYFFGSWRDDPKRDDAWKKREVDRLGDANKFKIINPETMDDFFSIMEGLIFKQFDKEEGGRHVKEFDYKEIRTGKIYNGYDHGSTDKHPSVFLSTIFNPYSQHLYVFDEIYWFCEQVENMAPDIVASNRAIYEATTKTYTKQLADYSIAQERGIISIASVFKKFGVQFSNCFKYKGLKGESGSLALLSAMFTHNKITIHPRCTFLIEELSTWAWNTKLKIPAPEDVNDNGPDVLRYIVAEVKPEQIGIAPTKPDHYSTERMQMRQRMDVLSQFQPEYRDHNVDGVNSWQGI